MLALRLFAFLTLCAPLLSAQAEWPLPKWEKVHLLSCPANGKALSSRIGRYEVRLVAAQNANIHETPCQGSLVDAAGHETRLLEDRQVSVYEGSGEDVFGDGHPSLILEGYSGGDHCCFTYEILSLGDRPIVLGPIHNESPVYFFKDPASHQYRIMTGDGGFHSFDGRCFDCSPFPRLVLQVDDMGIHDVSSQFAEQYDSEIALARAKIGEGEIARFQQVDFEDARKIVLEIVFSYLYSGRETEAWQTLDEMWPARDRDRIRKLIVATRAKGILSTLKEAKPRNIH